ncbi:DUF86 domain-containing protein [Candidatus Poribacteria bacterium]|nr:DUF86 domain-containing protein [Candidatus Poribacteria bacterium]
MRRDKDRLLDILEAIENIQKRLTAGRDAFFKDDLLQVWAVHHIQIIGEATANVSANLRNKHPQIPWADVVSMRNVLVHEYFGIDVDEIWDTVTNDLPKLKQQVEDILRLVD